MRPEDVPQFLVEKAEQALIAACDDGTCGICYCPTDDQIRMILAAVLPDTHCNCGFGGFHDDVNPRCDLNNISEEN